MKGRTENAVKNRYNSVMKKEKKKMRKNLENINETSFNSNTSLPSEDVEREIMKTLLVKKEKKNTQTTTNIDQMEIEGTIDAESVCSEASKCKKDKKVVSKERSVFHLCDLEVEKKGNILFELLKFDFQEEDRNINPFSFPVNPMLGSTGMQSFGNLPNNSFNPPGPNPINPAIRSQFLQMNPVINSSQQSLDSLNEISRGVSNPNITLPIPNQNNQTLSNFGNMNTNNPNVTTPSNFTSTNNTTNQGTNLFNNNTNKSSQLNQNFSSMNALPNTKPNFQNPFYGNIITNSFNNFQVPFDPMNPQMNPMMGPMNDPMLNNPMMEQTRAQLNNYYMHKNMELFEQFLLTNNSNVNNYHNFQNLQKMQKASPSNFTPSFNNLNQQYPGMFPPSMQNMNAMGNQPETQLNQPYPTADSITNNNDQLKFEESKKNLNNPNPNDNMMNIKFPSFIVPNNPPVLVNPLLQKIKFEENNNGSTPNTSNSHDSYRSLASSLASSLNTFGSLSSLSNISEPSPGFNAFNFFLNNQINNANNQNNTNPSGFQQKNMTTQNVSSKPQDNNNNQNNEKPGSLANPPTNLSNYNVKDISQFNMLDQNQSQLQFAIINPNKQEIYICGNLNTFKKEDQNMANLNKPNVRKQSSPRSHRKKNHTTCGMSPRSPSKFQDLSPRARLMQEESFGDYTNQG